MVTSCASWRHHWGEPPSSFWYPPGKIIDPWIGWWRRIYVVPPLGASILEVHVAVMDQWMVSWRRGVVSSTLTMTSLNGVAQPGLDDGRIIKNCMHLFNWEAWVILHFKKRDKFASMLVCLIYWWKQTYSYEPTHHINVIGVSLPNESVLHSSTHWNSRSWFRNYVPPKNPFNCKWSLS
jgi:hypothetical protein